MPGALPHSEHVVEPEWDAKVFAPSAPRRIVSYARIVGIGYPGVQYSEAARFWNCEAFNVNPLPGYGPVEGPAGNPRFAAHRRLRSISAASRTKEQGSANAVTTLRPQCLIPILHRIGCNQSEARA